VTRQRGDRWVLPTVAVIASCAAMMILALRLDPATLDYGARTVPVVVPWLAAVAAIVLAVVGLTPLATSVGGTALVAVGVITTGWSISTLLFDALRAVQLVPLPLSGWGLGLRLLLLLGAAAALHPVLHARASTRGRCPTCGRWRPGTLARLPLWPVAVGLVFALPYPVMRISWILGGTLGTTGGPVDADRTLQLVMAGAGVVLVALATVLLIDRGPSWLRVVLGFGGLIAGAGLCATFGPAAVGVASMLLAPGAGMPPAAGLMPWVFLVFYGSWFVAGIGVALGGLRYWTHRRYDCAACRDLRA
jgi:hypothetical protein